MAGLTIAREDVRFDSAGEGCAAWLYRPEEAGGEAPCVVLAHGFGALRQARLDAYAERFAAAGYAALVFDYRHHGASAGEPRQLIDIGRQHDDWRAAVAFARELDRVDPDRIVLWGSSFSGGHVIAIAADDPRVAAVVSQVPHTDGIATLRAAGPANLAKLTAAGMRDQAGALLGREPYLIPIVGPPGSLAAINSPDAEPGYSALYPDGFEWRNEFSARAALRVGTYSPLRKAAGVASPLLVQIAVDDVVTPPEPARKLAERAPQAELREYPGGHFDLYVGDAFEVVVADQLDFLRRHL
jgi:pimeloyl-ACP methyl ester carboxylesterase